MLYTARSTKKIMVKLPVATRAEISRSLNLSPTAKRRVARVIAQLGLKTKAG